MLIRLYLYRFITIKYHFHSIHICHFNIMAVLNFEFLFAYSKILPATMSSDFDSISDSDSVEEECIGSYVKVRSKNVPEQRSNLVNSVLNYNYVLSKKRLAEGCGNGSYEKDSIDEALFDLEDELYDVGMEFKLVTFLIDLLETVRFRMDEMSRKDRLNFELNDKLNGRSSSIPIQALEIVYGKDAYGVLNALQLNPIFTVSAVLQRLREHKLTLTTQTFEEFVKTHPKVMQLTQRRNQCNLIAYRIAEAKKILNVKTLMIDLKDIFEKRRRAKRNNWRPVKEGPHLEIYYSVDKKGAFYDAGRLIISAFDIEKRIAVLAKRIARLFVGQLLPQLFGSCVDSACAPHLKHDNEGPTIQRRRYALSHVNYLRRGTMRVDKRSSFAVKRHVEFVTNLDEVDIAEIEFTDESVVDDVLKRMCCWPISYRSSRVLILTQPYYLFLRLHYFAVEHLVNLQRECEKIAEHQFEMKYNYLKDTVFYKATCPKGGPIIADELYAAVMFMIFQRVTDRIDQKIFEFGLAEIFADDSWKVAMVVKVITNAARHLRFIVENDKSKELLAWQYAYLCKMKDAFSSRERKIIECNFQRQIKRLFLSDHVIAVRFDNYARKKISFEHLDTEEMAKIMHVEEELKKMEPLTELFLHAISDGEKYQLRSLLYKSKSTRSSLIRFVFFKNFEHFVKQLCFFLRLYFGTVLGRDFTTENANIIKRVSQLLKDDEISSSESESSESEKYESDASELSFTSYIEERRRSKRLNVNNSAEKNDPRCRESRNNSR
ncbi:Paired amphipathic helix protein Sin3b [Trichinella nativa]|uniref:Paired amphipathic helix protein Sin3b n=1 Tax=Trichinella nativa TaxID=6335 RepID=A0A0V1LPR5_9BILA|nr:Paired amphipathic helix protein Sin3b [Trichinella nativa]